MNNTTQDISMLNSEINLFYRQAKSLVERLVNMCNRSDIESLFGSLGNEAEMRHNQFIKLQDLLKSHYEDFIPLNFFKFIEVEEPSKDSEGNQVFKIETKFITNEETGEREKQQTNIPIMIKVRKKIFVEPSFNSDGSLYKFIEIN